MGVWVCIGCRLWKPMLHHCIGFDLWCVSCVQDIKFNVHAHPTLSEVLDELFKGAHVDSAPSKV